MKLQNFCIAHITIYKEVHIYIKFYAAKLIFDSFVFGTVFPLCLHLSMTSIQAMQVK